jgi:hypothetical protein
MYKVLIFTYIYEDDDSSLNLKETNEEADLLVSSYVTLPKNLIHLNLCRFFNEVRFWRHCSPQTLVTRQR